MQKCQLVDEAQRDVEVLLLFCSAVTHKNENKWILGLRSGQHNSLSVCSDFLSSSAGENLSALQF